MSYLVDGAPIDYSGLPEFARGPIERYIEGKRDPGSGYCDILAHDLFCVFSVDEPTLEALPQIVRWIYFHAPPTCHGSRTAVREWMRK